MAADLTPPDRVPDLAEYLAGGGSLLDPTHLDAIEGGTSALAGAGLRPLADVEERRVHWLWDRWLPVGEVVLLAGVPSSGKTMVLADIAARVTTAAPMPDSPRPESVGLRQEVLYLSREEDPAISTRPRLRVAGADLARVTVLAEDATMPALTDLDLLVAQIRSTAARLVIVDTLNAALGKGADANDNRGATEIMLPLMAVARACDCTIVLVQHLNKKLGQDAMSRMSGATAWAGTARAALLLGFAPDDARDADGQRLRVLAPVKCNLGPMPRALRLRIASAETSPESPHGVPRVEWLGADDASADDLVMPSAKRDTPERGKAEQWLRDALARGPLPVDDLVSAARDAGIARATLYRAKNSMGLASGRAASGENRWWIEHDHGGTDRDR